MRPATLLAALSLLLLPAIAHADAPSDATQDPQVSRLLDAKAML